MNKLIGKYINGNYTVRIYEDGTKIRETEEDDFIPEFPESMDLKITDYCNMNCDYCHENSSTNGEHADVLNASFINTLHPFTEIAIGGGNALAHPDLIPFLNILKEKGIIANITVNQYHFIESIDLIRNLIDNNLIHGLGVSLTNASEEFINLIQQFPNAVIHVINGVVDPDSLQSLYDKNLKILILGYKEFRRGFQYFLRKSGDITLKKTWINENIEEIIKRFRVVSFDNLALAQINIKDLLTEEHWNEFFMGNDGSYTLYIDLVNKKFAKSSTSTVRHNLTNDISSMFNIIKNI